MLFDKDAAVVASEQYEFRQKFPRSGWVEHDAEEIWESQYRAITGVLAQANCDWSEVASIGITNQRETVVAWDGRSGEALGNAIVWQDRRTARYCAELKAEGKESWIQDRTGLLLDPYFSASKMRWILEQRPEAMALLEEGNLRLGTVDAWLTWKLSGGASFITDVSNASRTLLMDLRTCEWDAELLELFGVDEGCLPRIVDSCGALARTSAEVTGGREISITGIAGDQQAALFGQLCFEPGMVKCTYGTGCFILMNTGKSPAVSRNKLLSTVAWRMNGKTEYALEGSVFVGGSAVQWLRDELGLIRSASEIEALARSVDDADGVLLVPAFTGLGAPYWDPYARGSLLGLTRGSSSAHIARATLDGIAYQVCDVAAAMASDAGRELGEIRADGGASANSLLMQIQADLSGSEVSCPEKLETTAMGAAFLAGLGIGFWESQEALAKLVKTHRRFRPTMCEGDREKRLSRWARAVERSREWASDD